LFLLGLDKGYVIITKVRTKETIMWQIIGSGAIGCLWAANLLRNHQDVQLITRKTISSATLHYQDLQQQKHCFKVPCQQTLINKQDPVLICVKATQVKQVILDQRPYFGDNQIIILMHNGMGCAEQVQALLPNNPIICATTANACLLHHAFNIQQMGVGATYLGAFSHPIKAQKSLISPLKSALDNTVWTDSIKQKLWLKLIINSCINPLTAVYQIKNGELQNSMFQEKIMVICEEALSIAKAENIFSEEISLINDVNKVIKATADNYSSMNRDIFYKRKTENDYINGYLLAKARQFSLPAPTIKALFYEVQKQEKNYC